MTFKRTGGHYLKSNIQLVGSSFPPVSDIPDHLQYTDNVKAKGRRKSAEEAAAPNTGAFPC